MMISGGRSKQLNIFCHITGFMSDFLSFIVVELIRFFHGTLQMIYVKHTANAQVQQLLHSECEIELCHFVHHDRLERHLAAKSDLTTYL